MLDKYFIKSGPSHVSVDVKEQRAPTDDSIRIYHEILDRARAEVVEAIAPANTIAEMVFFRRPLIDSFKDAYTYAFKLNGKVYSGSIDARDWEAAKDPRRAPELMMRLLSQAIAAKLLIEANR